MSLIRGVIRKARKEHVCNFCGCKIDRGERYEVATHVFEDKLYTWKSHVHCRDLCATLWDYVDPDESGMTCDDFIEAAQNAMSVFYCPFHCPQYDRDLRICSDYFDKDECIRTFAKFMDDKHLYLAQDGNVILCWKLAEAPC